MSTVGIFEGWWTPMTDARNLSPLNMSRLTKTPSRRPPRVTYRPPEHDPGDLEIKTHRTSSGAPAMTFTRAEIEGYGHDYGDEDRSQL